MNTKSNYIIANGIVADGRDIFIENGAIKIENGAITKIGRTSEFADSDSEFIDVGGRLILPGLLNAHHHLYSVLSTGTPTLGETPDFTHILENLWWPWDKALDDEAVYYSALLGAMESLKHGVTAVFDHHASMNFVRGSLSVEAEAVEKAGIRAALCFETSDRMGSESLREQIDENISFYNNCSKLAKLKSCFGLHANLTLSENSLAQIAEAKPAEMPIHAHCGEDIADLEHCRTLGYKGPVDRFSAFGLLSENAILAHCIHLSDKDIDLLIEREPIVANNSESNANNRVGFMNRKAGFPYVLGTDGMTGDIIAALRSHFLINSPFGIDFGELKRAFFTHRYAIQREYFPETGSFSPGSLADIAVLDYCPITPIESDNLMGHLVFGAKTGRAYLTAVDGEILYFDGEFTNLDEGYIIGMAREIAKKQKERYCG